MDDSCSGPLNGHLVDFVHFLLLITSLTPSVLANDNPVARLNTTWVNRPGDGLTYDDGSIARPWLLRGSSGPSFACGFFCRGSCNASLFSIFLVVTNNFSSITDPSSGFPQVVWSANRNNPVGEDARLELTAGGQLVLSDSDGTEVWSTDTLGKSVAGVNLTELGNLVLYDSSGDIVWQSFDHATDTVLPGQSATGQRLVASASAPNSTDGVLFCLNVTNSSFYAFIDSGTPGKYYSDDTRKNSDNNLLLPLTDGGMLLPLESQIRVGSATRTIPTKSTVEFLRLEGDGHLWMYRWSTDDLLWKAETDIFTKLSNFGNCVYPTVCSEYGICSDGQCSCPVEYFRAVDNTKPNRGCHPLRPLSCRHAETHMLFHLPNTFYFSYVQPADLLETDVESCKTACLQNCSCKAAFFKFGHDDSKGDCYLPSRVLSLIDAKDVDIGYNSSAFIKVQGGSAAGSASPHGGSAAGSESPHAAWKRSVVLGSSLGALFALLLLGVVAGIALQRRIRNKDELERRLQNLPSMPTSFTYEEMKRTTGNFSNKLGEGGFGSVFQGTLASGMRVAVKQLGGKGQGMKEFLAEVETIGSIHHVNLVRLMGYCAHKSHRLLVYEYMCNGSLDRWIFSRNEYENHPATLDWRTRYKIILHVAKGLAYLHEECRHRIVHLDIKPENILLDESFNAKLSDFGLSKLIDRDQSGVLTTMRGTPGYLAPEWLSSVITEKVDVFSFGVVVLEVMCGRRNIVSSRRKQSIPLVDEVSSAAREGRLLDVLDSNCRDMVGYREEAMEMASVALWCLQGEPDRRPSMSVVVKGLERDTGIEPFPDSNYPAPAHAMGHSEIYSSSSTPVLTSTLSGPR